MAYNEELAGRLRSALAHLPHVEEKKMFGGLAFMVNDKMCINVSEDSLMCRIDPATHDEALSKKGVETVKMKGKDYRGYVYVSQEVIKTKEAFDYWVQQALAFNKEAKSSKEK